MDFEFLNEDVLVRAIESCTAVAFVMLVLHEEVTLIAQLGFDVLHQTSVLFNFLEAQYVGIKILYLVFYGWDAHLWLQVLGVASVLEMVSQ